MSVDQSKGFYHRAMDPWHNRLIVPEGYVAHVNVGDGILKECGTGEHTFPHGQHIQKFEKLAEEAECQTPNSRSSGRSQTPTTPTSVTKSGRSRKK